jgi:hypothetical protein
LRESAYISAAICLIVLTMVISGIGSEAPGENAIVQEGQSPHLERVPLLQGIWTFSLAGAEVTMIMNQSGDSLFGQCKFEGSNPWNGVVSGSVSGKAVHIALAALRGEVLVSTALSGTLAEDTMDGSYIRSNSEGNAARGEFTASDYSPE